ncbi:hypothetical protein [Nocardia amamiensis]|uniref:hypothetical protein n=1 Tax=Nocardia amamiensis TaxID=404578 RepID=UPI00082B343B|nr:hypothetical protein [Nocardia amamiensis]
MTTSRDEIVCTRCRAHGARDRCWNCGRNKLTDLKNTTEAALGAEIAALARQFIVTLTDGLEDPESLYQRVIDLADQADTLGTHLLDSSEQPLHAPTLIKLVRAQTPENLHHLIGAPVHRDWGDDL